MGSHQGITGNENADELAKSETLPDNITGMPDSAADILLEMKVIMQARWQQEWQQQSWQLKIF